ncbi:protein NRT1/ PTR FAMILY 2.13 [Nicotiana tomentosiformis]|uniref:protein NRT1/ PTR FAMILY 2.13 n=1 Tax=Nicotiana tomentosiformis TaxID=4098 RepID=UPI00051C0E5C|nr:protein NRT1/ PTR FAMILY 2.13 isoform X1 [Nicotiana tomentosiformis]
MEDKNNQMKKSSSLNLSLPSPENGIYDEEKQSSSSDSPSKTSKRKPGGWRAMPYVLGNETFERLASIGLLANFMQFLLTVFHMDQVAASNVLNIWSGVTNFIPLLGAFLSDAYIGRFWTIAFASVFEMMGMLTLTFIPWLSQLHPPPCNPQVSQHCKGPNKSQLGFLVMGLGFLSIGSGGIRPCSIPFGVDQFDSTTDEGRKGIASFFNWYYTSFTVVLIIALTLVVYIQDSVSWVIGFGIPTVLMFLSLILFFIGTRVYVYVKPEGSIFSGIVQVFVAMHKKRKLKLFDERQSNGVFYDPPLPKGSIVKKLPLTNKFRSLNKAAIVMEGEINTNGTPTNTWRLCSIQQIEEVKCLLKIIPVWATGIICFTAMAQQGTFTMSQALKMDRHLGPKFQIPAGTLSVISMITIGIWLPIYDRLIVPSIRKITRIEGGITLLQRIGIGMVFSILSMVVAGQIEKVRRNSAIMHGSGDGIAPITVMWLAPQLILMGFAEAFNIIGQIEFYNKEFPENMSSLANSLFSCTVAGASYLSSFLVNILHNTTGGHGHPDWLTKDINEGRVENYYYLIAGLGVLNLFWFIYVARRYQYKTRLEVDDGIKLYSEVHELEEMKY